MLRKVNLGRTGIEVTELCFGVLPLGPLQKDITREDAVALLRKAYARGITFFDTAATYGTESYLGEALAGLENETIVATKAMNSDYEGMKENVEKSFRELKRDTIEIYHLHAARVDENVFNERKEALRCLHEYKEKGKIKAIGIATHNVKAVRESAKRTEIDIVFPLINRAGRGLLAGTTEEMIEAIGMAAAAGKGIYAMKALAGGALLGNIQESFDFVRQIDGINALAVGMVAEDELEYNLAYFSGLEIPGHLKGKEMERKKITIQRFCIGCGACVKACPNKALKVVEGKAVIDHSKCILCGYCNPVCDKFAIRIV